MSTATSGLLVGTSRPPVACDSFVPGRIGKLDLGSGCYSFYEAWTIAARQIAEDGRYEEARAAIDGGATVRSLLRDWYGVLSEPTDDSTAFYETRAFRRSMRYEHSARRAVKGRQWAA